MIVDWENSTVKRSKPYPPGKYLEDFGPGHKEISLVPAFCCFLRKMANLFEGKVRS